MIKDLTVQEFVSLISGITILMTLLVNGGIQFLQMRLQAKANKASAEAQGKSANGSLLVNMAGASSQHIETLRKELEATTKDMQELREQLKEERKAREKLENILNEVIESLHLNMKARQAIAKSKPSCKKCIDIDNALDLKLQGIIAMKEA